MLTAIPWRCRTTPPGCPSRGVQAWSPRTACTGYRSPAAAPPAGSRRRSGAATDATDPIIALIARIASVTSVIAPSAVKVVVASVSVMVVVNVSVVVVATARKTAVGATSAVIKVLVVTLPPPRVLLVTAPARSSLLAYAAVVESTATSPATATWLTPAPVTRVARRATSHGTAWMWAIPVRRV